ncbi:hypothetical protein A4S06_11620 [Erysipelotrichaceae bacterium MTC7]|nr:hypothetical protein A4S06_11620 [Erysipelotrichaceae bacterium MTC7]
MKIYTQEEKYFIQFYKPTSIEELRLLLVNSRTNFPIQKSFTDSLLIKLSSEDESGLLTLIEENSVLVFHSNHGKKE